MTTPGKRLPRTGEVQRSSIPKPPVPPKPRALLDEPMTHDEAAWWRRERVRVFGPRLALQTTLFMLGFGGAAVIAEWRRNPATFDLADAMKALWLTFVFAVIASVTLLVNYTEERDKRVRHRRLQRAMLEDEPPSRAHATED